MKTLKEDLAAGNYENAQFVPMFQVVPEDISCRTTLKTVIYSERMRPVLCPGDAVHFVKLNNLNIIQWGEVHLVQVGEYNVVCRVHPGSTDEAIKISYEADTVTQEFSLNMVAAVWKLEATLRLN